MEDRLRVWNVRTGKVVVAFDESWQHSRALAFTRDGKALLSALGGLRISQWDLRTGRRTRLLDRDDPARGVLDDVLAIDTGREELFALDKGLEVLKDPSCSI
jgi:hypothetical protein